MTKDEMTVTPWEVSGEINYDKLIKEFGTNKESYEKMGKEHRHSLEKSKNNSTFNKD